MIADALDHGHFILPFASHSRLICCTVEASPPPKSPPPCDPLQFRMAVPSQHTILAAFPISSGGCWPGGPTPPLSVPLPHSPLQYVKLGYLRGRRRRRPQSSSSMAERTWRREKTAATRCWHSPRAAAKQLRSGRRSRSVRLERLGRTDEIEEMIKGFARLAAYVPHGSPERRIWMWRARQWP